jgi:hypothetical protein
MNLTAELKLIHPHRMLVFLGYELTRQHPVYRLYASGHRSIPARSICLFMDEQEKLSLLDTGSWQTYSRATFFLQSLGWPTEAEVLTRLQALRQFQLADPEAMEPVEKPVLLLKYLFPVHDLGIPDWEAVPNTSESLKAAFEQRGFSGKIFAQNGAWTFPAFWKGELSNALTVDFARRQVKTLTGQAGIWNNRLPPMVEKLVVGFSPFALLAWLWTGRRMPIHTLCALCVPGAAGDGSGCFQASMTLLAGKLLEIKQSYGITGLEVLAETTLADGMLRLGLLCELANLTGSGGALSVSCAVQPAGVQVRFIYERAAKTGKKANLTLLFTQFVSDLSTELRQKIAPDKLEEEGFLDQVRFGKERMEYSNRVAWVVYVPPSALHLAIVTEKIVSFLQLENWVSQRAY